MSARKPKRQAKAQSSAIDGAVGIDREEKIRQVRAISDLLFMAPKDSLDQDTVSISTALIHDLACQLESEEAGL